MSDPKCFTDLAKLRETVAKIDHLLGREEHDSGYAAFVHMRKIWPDLKGMLDNAQAKPEPQTLAGMIQAVYGNMDAEDCSFIDFEWARQRGYILPNNGTGQLQPVPRGDKGEAVGCGDPNCKDPSCAYGKEPRWEYNGDYLFRDGVNVFHFRFTEEQQGLIAELVRDANAAPQPASNAEPGSCLRLPHGIACDDLAAAISERDAARAGGAAYTAIEPEVFTRRLELARKFIAREYNDPAQELRGDWIDPRAKPAHDAICLCLQDLSSVPSTDREGGK